MTRPRRVKLIEGVTSFYVDGLHENDAGQDAKAPFHQHSAADQRTGRRELMILPQRPGLEKCGQDSRRSQQGLPRHDEVLALISSVRRML